MDLVLGITAYIMFNFFLRPFNSISVLALALTNFAHISNSCLHLTTKNAKKEQQQNVNKNKHKHTCKHK